MGGVKRTVSQDAVRAGLDELIEGVCRRGDEVVIEQNGEQVAVLVPRSRYEAMERERERFLDLIERMRAFNDDKDPDEIEREVAEAVREVRAARRSAS